MKSSHPEQLFNELVDEISYVDKIQIKKWLYTSGGNCFARFMSSVLAIYLAEIANVSRDNPYFAEECSFIQGQANAVNVIMDFLDKISKTKEQGD